MSFTTNRYRTATGERLATIKITVKVTADDIAHALASDAGAWADRGDLRTEVTVSEDAIRDALYHLFLDGLEMAQCRVGDNNSEARCEEIKAEVVDVVFEGREFYEVQS